MSLSVSQFETENPRLLLQTELTRRIQRNPRYSLRRFAQAMGISHTVLSLVMSGKRPLSKKAAARVSDFLGLGPHERDRLIANRASGKDGEARGVVLQASESETYQMSLDTFAVVSDWYHLAILSLLEIPSSKFEARWISVRLGISEIEAQAAIDRLQRLELVAKNEKGRWRQSGRPIRFENRDSTAATRNYHTQLLARAQESLERDECQFPGFHSITLAIDPKDLDFAKQADPRISPQARRRARRPRLAQASLQLEHTTLSTFTIPNGGIMKSIILPLS